MRLDREDDDVGCGEVEGRGVGGRGEMDRDGDLEHVRDKDEVPNLEELQRRGMEEVRSR